MPIDKQVDSFDNTRIGGDGNTNNEGQDDEIFGNNNIRNRFRAWVLCADAVLASQE